MLVDVKGHRALEQRPAVPDDRRHACTRALRTGALDGEVAPRSCGPGGGRPAHFGCYESAERQRLLRRSFPLQAPSSRPGRGTAGVTFTAARRPATPTRVPASPLDGRPGFVGGRPHLPAGGLVATLPCRGRRRTKGARNGGEKHVAGGGARGYPRAVVIECRSCFAPAIVLNEALNGRDPPSAATTAGPRAPTGAASRCMSASCQAGR